MYRGEEAADLFVRKLQLEAIQLRDEYITTPKPMMFTVPDLQSFTRLPSTFLQTRLEKIRYVTTVILQENTAVLLTMNAI